MKITWILFLMLIVCFSCKVFQSDPIDNSLEKALVGRWVEYWGIGGVETDVDDNDTIEFYIEKNKLHIKCVNDNDFIFRRISYDNGQLLFRVENKDNPKERFFIYYKLIISQDSCTLDGSIINSKNQTDSVRFIKIKNGLQHHLNFKGAELQIVESLHLFASLVKIGVTDLEKRPKPGTFIAGTAAKFDYCAKANV